MIIKLQIPSPFKCSTLTFFYTYPFPHNMLIFQAMVVIGSISQPFQKEKNVCSKDASLLCLQRIKKIQQYLTDEKIGGVIAVNGIDSRYNPDCRHFINFILFGCSLYKTGNFSKYFDIDTDEVVMIIKPCKVELYVTHKQMSSILPFLTKVHDLQIHCIDSNISSDENIVEDHKVYSFISMTQGIDVIAVPLSIDAHSFDPMAIEKWPLLQAYALEDYGSQGFFGLSHKLVPFDFEKLHIFRDFDLGSLKHLLKDTSMLLNFQWNTMIKNVSNMIKNGSLDGCLDKAIDPVASYLKHGNQINSSHDDTYFILENHAVTGKPLFITCSVKESSSSLSCGRTYFIHENIDSSDLVLLSSIYDAMASTAHRTIQRYLSTQNESKLGQYFSKKFTEKLGTYKYPQLINFKASSVKINVILEAYDVKGNKVKEFSSPKSSMKVFGVSISNICSLQNTKIVYKPLVFQDTFFESHILIENDDVSANDSELLIVTDVIPTYVQWNHFGEPREDSVPCSLICNDVNTYEAMFRLENNTIAITSSYSTPLQIRINDLKEIRVKKSGSIAVAVYMEHASNCLPPFLKRFCLVFWQRGKGIRFFSDTLLPLFREYNILESMESLPSDFLLRYENIVSVKTNDVSNPNSSDDGRLIESAYPTYPVFASHMMLSSLGSHTYNQIDVNPTMRADAPDPFIFVTLLIGIPGSNQEKICSIVTEGTKQDHHFIVLRQPLGSEELFSALNLQKALHMLSKRGNDPIRVMVIVSAYVEVPEVVSAIVQHPDKFVRQSCHVSSICSCVDLRNLFVSNRTCFPKIVEQCSEGWVNNIIVTGCSPTKQKGKDDRINFLRTINPSCRIIEVEGNNFIDKDSLDEICAVDAFYESTLPTSRHLTAPGWFTLKYKPNPPFIPISYLTVSFSGELCKARFMSHLKSLHQKEGRVYVDRLMMSGSIFYVGGRTKFSDDSNLYTLECTPRSEAISLNLFNKPLPPGSKNCFVFTGYKITEEQVKHWLQGCAPKPPAKKEKYTKFSLSAQEKEMLKVQASREQLPEGWFYNGSHYVSMMEGKKMEHPLFDDIVNRFLEMKNKEIELFNQKIDATKDSSLFGS